MRWVSEQSVLGTLKPHLTWTACHSLRTTAATHPRVQYNQNRGSREMLSGIGQGSFHAIDERPRGPAAMTSVSQTEASCLLHSGPLYRRRVGLVPTSGRAEMVFAGFKKGAFSLYFGDAPIYHFDLKGAGSAVPGTDPLSQEPGHQRSVDRPGARGGQPSAQAEGSRRG